MSVSSNAVYNSSPAEVRIGEWTLLEIATQVATINANPPKTEDHLERVLWFLRYVYVVGCGDGHAQGLREMDEIVSKAFSKAGVAVAAQATPAIFEALEAKNART